MKTNKQYFVAGTDTGVGKTLVAAALLHLASERGLASIGLKPVAAGCERSPAGLRNHDAELLARHASVELPYGEINPLALEQAIAPHIAAEREGRRLAAAPLVGHCRKAMMRSHQFCLVEGAGGWRVPLNARESLADVAKGLSLPVILVVGMRLGCLNHALLSAEAILRDGLDIAAWVANVVEPQMAALRENMATLAARLPFPMLGLIPFQEAITPKFAAAHLDISNLL